MTRGWLLIETFGGDAHPEPTVIGVGSTPKGMVPLTTILGRGRHLDDVRAVVARVANGAGHVRTPTSDGTHVVVADPLIAYSGEVHGAHVWVGRTDEVPPLRDPAGAWHFNLTTGTIGGSDDLLDLYGVPPAERQPERAIAEAFTRLVTNADESAALAKIVTAPPGTEHQATWTVRRDDGELRAANFACRCISERAPDGGQHSVLKGITHDIGPAAAIPAAPRRILLAQQVLEAARTPGTWRGIVNLRNLTLLRWIDEPMPGIAWEHNPRNPPAIHPDDRPATKALSRQLADAGRAHGALRLMGTDGRWVPVQIEASLMLLDQHTTAGFVTLSRSEPHPDV